MHYIFARFCTTSSQPVNFASPSQNEREKERNRSLSVAGDGSGRRCGKPGQRKSDVEKKRGTSVSSKSILRLAFIRVKLAR